MHPLKSWTIEIEEEIRALLAYADADYWMVRYFEGATKYERLSIEGPASDGSDLSARSEDILPRG
jgi:hypothetical protein